MTGPEAVEIAELAHLDQVHAHIRNVRIRYEAWQAANVAADFQAWLAHPSTQP